MPVFTCLLRRAELRHGQTWPHPSYLWMRCSGCSLPSGLVLQVLQRCCTSLRRYNRAAGLLRLLALRAGTAILRERHAFRNAPASPGHFWCPMAEHGLHKTLYNVLLPHSQPKPREQPLLQQGVPWRHHPWRNMIPEFPFPGYSLQLPQLKERGWLTCYREKEIVALRVTGLPCLCSPSRRAAAPGLQGDGKEVLASLIWC